MGKDDILNKGKTFYLEYLRAFATITVVFLHIVMTLPNNYSVEELGLINSMIFNSSYMFTRWAVPCFFMISGAIMLQPQKKYSVFKVINYIKRMIIVLFVFGTAYACMEIVFSEKQINLLTIPKAVLCVAEGKSWDHLWYIYTLISLYIFLIPLKAIINYLEEKELNLLIYALCIGNFLIPSISIILKIELKTFMVVNEYVTFFVLGYWLVNKESRRIIAVFLVIIVTILMIITELLSLQFNGDVFVLNHESKDIFTLLQALGVFVVVKDYFSKKDRMNVIIECICKYSFLIYILHPFFINLLYKVLMITPLSFPLTSIGIIVLTIIVFLLSYFTAAIVKRIPVINKYV